MTKKSTGYDDEDDRVQIDEDNFFQGVAVAIGLVFFLIITLIALRYYFL